MPDGSLSAGGESSTWGSRAGSWTRGDFALAGLVGLVTAVVAWVFRTEIVSTDPWHYVMAAIQFPQHTWVPLGYTRYGMIVPLAPLVIAWGYAPATFYVPALAASACMAGSVYLLGRRFWGPMAGVTAVVLLLSNWVVFPNLARFYPDIPSIALVLLALVLAVAARDYDGPGRWRGDALVVAAGFLLGWSFEARETALFAWPIVIAALWVKGRVRRNALLAAAPVIGWAIVDVTIGAVAYGDPLLKLHTFTRQDLSTTSNPADLAVLNQFVGLPRLDYLTMIPRLILHGAVPGGLWLLALAAVTLLGFLVRDTAVRLCAAAFVVSYLLFVGVSGFFLPSHPAGRLDVQRYWIQFVPWIALATAGVLHVVVGALARRRGARYAQYLGAAGSAILVAASVALVAPTIQSSPALATNGGAVLSDVSGELARMDPGTGAAIYTDWQTMRILPIYRHPAFGGTSQWTTPLRSLTGKETPRPGDLVLLVASRSSPCGFCSAALTPWRKSHPALPADWKRVFTTADGGYTLYRVG
ncbi:MAG: glycosyltransferase family 39 protein [Intrasporangium sp.]|uniref:glycosyltransferase family 39 protein n=1 Tax=Intrasporangium sp. TaxID=1925024 RepID=UPI003F7E7CF8